MASATADFGRFLNLKMLELAANDSRTRINALNDIKINFRSHSTEVKQEALARITSRLSAERDPAVKDALSELAGMCTLESIFYC